MFNEFNNSRVFVAGANSFLASYLIESILHYNRSSKNKSCFITGLVRNIKKAKKRYSAYLDSKDLELIEGDISLIDPNSIKTDYIIHAASQASPKYFGVDPVGTFMPNVEGTKRLLEAALKNKVKSFLFFSSAEVYGPAVSEDGFVNEGIFAGIDPMHIRSCYSEGKRAGETLCKAFATQYGVDVKVVRPFHTYGPGMDLNDGRIFADFVGNVIKGEELLIKSDGKAVRAYCYLRDAVLGFLTVMMKGKNGEAYNIGNDNACVSVSELAEIIVKIIPEKKIKIHYDIGAIEYTKTNVMSIKPDISKAKKIGFNPSVGIKEGFERTIKSYL